MRRNPELDAITGELRAADVEYKILRRKHYKVRWVVKGQARIAIAPHTGSDFRSARNARAMVRRMLRADGL